MENNNLFITDIAFCDKLFCNTPVLFKSYHYITSKRPLQLTSKEINTRCHEIADFETPSRGIREGSDVPAVRDAMATDDEAEHEVHFGDLGDADDEDRIVINVGGTRHESLVTTLISKPGTRLSHIANRHTGGRAKEYYFDRHPGVFTTVMDYYRSGEQDILIYDPNI